MSDPEKQARIFKVLSVSTRISMIKLLKKKSLCVNALARSLNISPAAVSQHLRVLRDADIVSSDKQGYFVHYRLNRNTLVKLNREANNLLETDKH